MTVLLGQSFGADAIFTRPDNTTTYGAGDVVGPATGASGAILPLVSAGPSGIQGLVINSTALLIGASAVPAGMTTFALHIYGSSPGSVFGDGDTWDLPSGDRSAYLGALALGTPVDVGASLYVGVDNINKQVRMGGNAAGNLWAYLVTTGTWDPAALTPFRASIRGLGF